MLSNRHFYHQLTKKYVTIFGNLFNDIWLLKRDNDTAAEIERRKVPVIYSPKEKWVTRPETDGPLAKQVQITLPRMGFEIVDMRWAGEKKKMTTLRHVAANTASQYSSQYVEVPYDLTFRLEIYARNIDDADQIMEQILPYFTPDYTVNALLIPEMSHYRDIFVKLMSIEDKFEYAGDRDSTRIVTKSLVFNMGAYYYGAVTQSSLIRHAITNIYNHPELRAGYITKVNLTGGNSGDYPIDSWVYQGNSEATAYATAKVIKWEKANGDLYLGGTQGNFKSNQFVYSVETNAKYNLITFAANPIKLANISISPNPVTANVDDAYGYTTIITEFPDTLE